MSTYSSSSELYDQADDLAYTSTAPQYVTAQSSSIGQVALPARESRPTLSLNTTDGYIPASEEQSVTSSSPKDVSSFLVLRLSNEFARIIDEQGDTLIYIGPPAKTKGLLHSEYLHIERHFNRFHLVDSNKLKALNSSKINRLLGPRACIFAAKRFKTLDSYQALSQQTKNAARYHVDLRPAQMEDEAVILLTELSCSKGTCNWYLAHGRYSVPKTVVMGTDYLDTESNPYYNILNRLPKQNVLPHLGPVAEYSALRHHSGLERLLYAACGQDPKLDSAPKMWTFFSLALFFGCAGHPLINQWVSSWLKKPRNNNFIQNNPEVAFRIGMGIMDANLVRVAFSILVGEKALMIVCNEGETTIAPRPQSIHGRMLENLDDDEQNRISHAASSLVSRMKSFFKSVVDDLDWMWASTEYQKLLNAEADSYTAESAIHRAKTLLEEFVKGRCLTILHTRLREPPPELEKYPQNVAPFRHGLVVPFFEGLYSNLQPNTRYFTRSFWIALSKGNFNFGFKNTDVSHMTELMTPSNPDNIACVTRRTVDAAFDILNRALSHEDHKPEPSPSIFNNKPCYQPIHTSVLLRELSTALASHICDPIIYPSHLFYTDDPVPVNLIDHLLNLDESEWNFLPLWAGGLDDGSGGVFVGQDIPNGPTTTGGSSSSHHDSCDPREGWLFQGGKRGISRSRIMDMDMDYKGKGKMKEASATATATSADTMTDTIIISPVTGDDDNSNYNRNDDDDGDEQLTIMSTFSDDNDRDDEEDDK
ncbi:hypothetical protein DV736_g4847, partial [Chaetothyriales sp. CBS 134916]